MSIEFWACDWFPIERLLPQVDFILYNVEWIHIFYDRLCH
jgi:hypothetical protein